MPISHEARRVRREEICQHAKNGVYPEELADIYDLSLASIKTYLNARGLRWKKKRDRFDRIDAESAPKKPFMPMGKVVTPNRPIWDFVNWEAPDSVIALVLRVSRERIRQVREARGITASPDKFSQGTIKFFRIYCRNHSAELYGKHVHEIVATAGHSINLRMASKILTDLGIVHSCARGDGNRHNNSLVPWQKMNWSLPNVDLFKAWKIVLRTQSFSRSRSAFQKGPIVLKRGTPEHATAVDLEMKKAQDWFKTPEGRIAIVSCEAMRRAMQDPSANSVMDEERNDLINNTDFVRV